MKLDTGPFQTISIMIDEPLWRLPNYSGRYHAERTYYENLPNCTAWFPEETKMWNIGNIVPWVNDYLVLHLSFNGGTVPNDFWQEWVYPNIERYIGAIYFVDLARPELFPEVRHDLHKYNNANYDSNMFVAPPVIALTRINEPTSWSQNDLKLYLRSVIQETEYIVVEPKNWESVKQLLIQSLEHFAKYL